MRFDGFIMPTRNLFYSVWGNLSTNCKDVMFTLFFLANFHQSEVPLNGEQITILPGQCLISIRGIMRWCSKELTYDMIRTAIKKLEEFEIISIQPLRGNHRIFTINKEYLLHGDNTIPEVSQTYPNAIPEESHHPNKGKKGIKKEKTYSLRPEYVEKAELLKQSILENNPKANITDRQVEKWADTVRLMVERDNYTLEDIDSVIRWCQSDSFWQSNILSMQKLREKWNTLTAKMLNENKCNHSKALQNNLNDSWKSQDDSGTL